MTGPDLRIEGADGRTVALSVCCGFHAGSPALSRQALREAKRCRIPAGALVAYPDLESGGERPLLLTSGEIRNLARHQIRELDALARGLGLRLTHARPQGALWRQALSDPRIALAVAHGIEATFLGLPVPAPAGSALAREARRLEMRVIPVVVLRSPPGTLRLAPP